MTKYKNKKKSSMLPLQPSLPYPIPLSYLTEGEQVGDPHSPSCLPGPTPSLIPSPEAEVLPVFPLFLYSLWTPQVLTADPVFFAPMDPQSCAFLVHCYTFSQLLKTKKQILPSPQQPHLTGTQKHPYQETHSHHRVLRSEKDNRSQ